MKLDVLQPATDEQPPKLPWYGNGLTFTCQQCGNCCTGAPGYVWISDHEIDRLAAFKSMSREQVMETYCRQIGQRVSLQERRTPQGLYDCIFLEEVKLRNGSVKRICGIYDARPLQCRTWPFWDGLLANRESWENAAGRCHGINHGSRRFTRGQIDALREATDWPDRPPTSAPPPAAPATRAHRAVQAASKATTTTPRLTSRK